MCVTQCLSGSVEGLIAPCPVKGALGSWTRVRSQTIVLRNVGNRNMEWTSSFLDRNAISDKIGFTKKDQSFLVLLRTLVISLASKGLLGVICLCFVLSHSGVLRATVGKYLSECRGSQLKCCPPKPVIVIFQRVPPFQESVPPSPLPKGPPSNLYLLANAPIPPSPSPSPSLHTFRVPGGGESPRLV